mmetsp:Transcript_48709/g.128435  ORF Transcript_48709/g.128435 Transcript_48709/m.128435 type:complete len:229 (+) Transcript_48709:3027-3713(+)
MLMNDRDERPEEVVQRLSDMLCPIGLPRQRLGQLGEPACVREHHCSGKAGEHGIIPALHGRLQEYLPLVQAHQAVRDASLQHPRHKAEQRGFVRHVLWDDAGPLTPLHRKDLLPPGVRPGCGKGRLHDLPLGSNHHQVGVHSVFVRLFLHHCLHLLRHVSLVHVALHRRLPGGGGRGDTLRQGRYRWRRRLRERRERGRGAGGGADTAQRRELLPPAAADSTAATRRR